MSLNGASREALIDFHLIVRFLESSGLTSHVLELVKFFAKLTYQKYKSGYLKRGELGSR